MNFKAIINMSIWQLYLLGFARFVATKLTILR